jgi:hypothetical protein
MQSSSIIMMLSTPSHYRISHGKVGQSVLTVHLRWTRRQYRETSSDFAIKSHPC